MAKGRKEESKNRSEDKTAIVCSIIHSEREWSAARTHTSHPAIEMDPQRIELRVTVACTAAPHQTIHEHLFLFYFIFCIGLSILRFYYFILFYSTAPCRKRTHTHTPDQIYIYIHSVCARMNDTDKSANVFLIDSDFGGSTMTLYRRRRRRILYIIIGARPRYYSVQAAIVYCATCPPTSQLWCHLPSENSGYGLLTLLRLHLSSFWCLTSDHAIYTLHQTSDNNVVVVVVGNDVPCPRVWHQEGRPFATVCRMSIVDYWI